LDYYTKLTKIWIAYDVTSREISMMLCRESLANNV